MNHKVLPTSTAPTKIADQNIIRAFLFRFFKGSIKFRLALAGNSALLVSNPPNSKLIFTCQLIAQPEASSNGPSVLLRNFNQANITDGPDIIKNKPKSSNGNCHQEREKIA